MECIRLENSVDGTEFSMGFPNGLHRSRSYRVDLSIRYILCNSRLVGKSINQMKKTQFPDGWSEERVRQVLAHYEHQTEDEAVAEDEAAYEDKSLTTMEIPTELVPAVRELIAKNVK